MGCANSTEAVDYDHTLYSARVEWETYEEGRVPVSGSPPENRQLFYRAWMPKAEARAYVFAVHGLHEHGGRFTEFAHTLTKVGVAVFAADYYAHGQSNGTLGLLPNASWLYVDQAEFIEATLARTNFSGPIFLHAHSLGTLIGLHLAHILPIRNPDLSIRAIGMTGVALDPGPGAASPFGMQSLFCLAQLGGLLSWTCLLLRNDCSICPQCTYH